MNIQEGINQLLGYGAAGTGFIRHGAQQHLEREIKNTDFNNTLTNERVGRYNEAIGKSPRYKSELKTPINLKEVSKFRETDYDNTNIIGLHKAIKQEKRFQNQATALYNVSNPSEALKTRKEVAKSQRMEAAKRRMADSVQTEFDTKITQEQNFNDLMWKVKGGEWQNG